MPITGLCPFLPGRLRIANDESIARQSADRCFEHELGSRRLTSRELLRFEKNQMSEVMRSAEVYVNR